MEAIEQGNADGIMEELGDVLLQVVFHAQIATEEGSFDFDGIADNLANKLIERHPHVFGGEGPEPEPLASAQAVRNTWEERKSRQRNSRMDGIPAALPALQRASKAGSRAAHAGFDWRGRQDIEAKIQEEIAEFNAEIDQRDGGPEREAALELEFGDLLFALTQIARWEGVEPERALRRSTNKFIARFRWMEQEMHAQNEKAENLSDDKWWRLWARAKQAVEPG